MIVGPEALLKVYQAIKCERVAGQKLPIFVSTLEADSVCAYSVLERLLSNDGVLFSAYFVSRFEQIRSRLAELVPTDNSRKNVVLINCGACEDALTLLAPQSNTRLIIIDSRRPINVSLGEADLGTALVVSTEDDLTLASKAGFPTTADTELRSDEEPEDWDSGEASGSGKRVREERAEARKEQRKRRKREVREQLAQYYGAGSFWGRPSTLYMLDLALSLGQADKMTVWLAAVALADHFNYQRIPLERYRECADSLHDQVSLLGGADPPNGAEMGRNPATRVVPVEGDLIFPLLRRWSLWDAMLHCPYVAVRLHTYTDRGKKQLELLLAKMGFKIADSKGEYKQMPDKLKTLLQSRLAEFGPAFGLNELTFKGFYLHWGYQQPLSATDAAYMVSALLESHLTWPGKGLSPEEAFGKAHRALEPRRVDDIRDGISLAKLIQQSILEDCGTLLRQCFVMTGCKKFIYVDLTDALLSRGGLVCQPMALQRLAMLLRDREAWANARRKNMSIIIFGKPHGGGSGGADGEEEPLCPVVSVSTRPMLSDAEGNRMPLLLEEAAESVRCTLDTGGFNHAAGLVPRQQIGSLVDEMITICCQRRVGQR